MSNQGVPHHKDNFDYKVDNRWLARDKLHFEINIIRLTQWETKYAKWRASNDQKSN